MINLYLKAISDKLKISLPQVENTVKLFEDGATIPFIARYRKERTGSLNEVEITAIRKAYDDFQTLEKRKETILKTLRELDKLNPQLESTISTVTDAHFLEDLYAPYKPKRATRATKARELGLEPMAKAVYYTKARSMQEFLALKPAGVSDEDALQGAMDIVAEMLSGEIRLKNAVRRRLKSIRVETSFTKAAATNENASNYKQFASLRCTLARMEAHQVMAMFRAENEGIISIKEDLHEVDDTLAKNLYNEYTNKYRRPYAELAPFMQDACADALKRLIVPSVVNELYAFHKDRAQKECVRIFSENLQSLLLYPPVFQKNVLALDPGFRTGCKVAVINRNGDFLDHDVIYPHPPKSEKVASIQKITHLVEKYDIEAIAIGSGTASRETEQFIAKVPGLDDVDIYVVSEDGASIYSASELAQKEFPELDLTVRGAISIGRRLQDPLAELVKIDPKNLGVGQYQHDVDPVLMETELMRVVESCVNKVGVNLNTASPYLLQYVSGIGPKMALNIYNYRVANGDFRSREDLLKVPRLGAKAYEQCAGFLRISGGVNPLDNSSVHPEAYRIVAKMAAALDVAPAALISNDALLSKIDPQAFVDDEFGLPTITDILEELHKPGRDPRGKASVFAFSEEVRTIEDLREGMILPGIITNITAFGAFVDLGIHVNGLIGARHLSEKNKLHLRDAVKVKVTNIDLERNRISLCLS